MRKPSSKSLSNLVPYPKGVSGNPSGISNSTKTFEAACRSHTPKMLDMLTKIMYDENTEEKTKIYIAQYLLDRGHGKAPTAVFDETGGITKLPADMTTEEILACRVNGAIGLLAKWAQDGVVQVKDGILQKRLEIVRAEDNKSV